jgi:hypothetical protein
MLRFSDASYKEVLMANRHRLRSTNIYVNDHYSVAVERDRKRLYPIMRKARGIPEYDNKISLVGAKIVLDGEEISVNDFDKLPSNIHPRDICTERRDNTTYFFRQDSPLSNHFNCSFTLDGVSYTSSEQAYFHKKSQVCKDEVAGGRIMRTSIPGIQKGIGEHIKPTPDWTDTKKIAIMKRACSEKFQQNRDLCEFLLKTENTLLAEDNQNDSFWGIGLSRQSPRSKNTANHKSNHMGLILMEIRDNVTMQ